MKYQEAVNLRQKILDFANKAGSINARDVSVEFGFDMDYSYKTIRKMEKAGEFRRDGAGHKLRFTPCKTQTRGAGEIAKIAQQKRVETRNDGCDKPVAMNVTRVIGSKTIHRGSERDRPIANQGGQGSRAVGSIQSSFGMI